MSDPPASDLNPVVDLVRDDGTSTRYLPGPLAGAGLPHDALPRSVAWSRTDARTGAVSIALAAPDGPANRQALRDAGWIPAASE